MSYPTIEDVQVANRYTICAWWRRLPLAETEEQEKIMLVIYQRFVAFGGFTPEISKHVGW